MVSKQFGSWFYQIKGRQQIGKKVSIQAVLQKKSEGIRGILYLAAKNFDLLFKIQDQN
jgi:hypothetical protein